jgi:hypothetical protein
MTILTSHHSTIALESHSTGKSDEWEDMLEGLDWGVHRLLRALQLTPAWQAVILNKGQCTRYS